LPSTTAAADHPFCPLLGHASVLGVATSRNLLKDWNISPNLKKALNEISSLSNDAKESILLDSADQLCTRQVGLSETLPHKNFILGNGRIFPIEGASLVREDIDLLLSIELERAKAVLRLLERHITVQGSGDFANVTRVVSYLSIEAESSISRSGITGLVNDLVKNSAEDVAPLYLSWNGAAETSLQVRIPGFQLVLQICALIQFNTRTNR
jgi:hypothetical protein